MPSKIKIKSDGKLYSSSITTESGEEILCSDFRIRIMNGTVYAILTVPQPILEIETENYEVK